MITMNDNDQIKALENMGVIDHIPKAARYALLVESGKPRSASAIAAGYSPKTMPATIEGTAAYKAYKNKIRQKRQELSERAGLTIEDSANFYNDMAKTASTHNVRIRARETLDKLLGYFAPIEVERDNEGPERPSISILSICQQYNINPSDLLRQANNPGFQPLNVKENNVQSVLPPADGRKTGNLPLNNTASNNNYVNQITNVSSEESQGPEVEGQALPGRVHPQKKSGPGGGSEIQAACDNRVPPPYHEVSLVG
jgi:hypothetical protein